MRKFSLIILSIVFSLQAKAEDLSVDITSDSLVVERLDGTAVFSGNVKALYKDLTLTSESLKIKYDEKSKSDNKIKTILAEKKVVLIQGTDKVTAEYAEYFIDKDEIIFKQNVILNRNGNILQGDHLVMNTLTKQAKMSSTGEKRVKALYFNNADKGVKNEEPVLENNEKGVVYE